MNETDNSRWNVTIIGAGITGLAAALRLAEWRTETGAPMDIQVLESADRPGGVLSTKRRDGYLVEQSADMFTTKEPWALDLCKRIGFERDLIAPNNRFRRAFVANSRGLFPVPEGFTLLAPSKMWPIAMSPLLSVWGKVRLAMEPWIARKQDSDDESLASFATRRLGKNAFENLIQPLVGGIYTADPEKLSMQATLSQFVDMEKKFGSVTWGMLRGPRSTPADGAGARYGQFVAPREGMSQLVEAITAKLSGLGVAVRLKTHVHELTRSEDGWTLRLEGAAPLRCDAVIIATPATRTAQLVGSVDVDLEQLLRQIPYASSAVVVAGYKRSQIRHALDGFGYVAPANANRKVLAGSFASVKFPGRCGEDRVLMRTFVGGVLQPELLRLDDQQLANLAVAENASLLGITGEPEWSEVVRWTNAMPQYHVGHLERVAQIEERAAHHPGLFFAGAAYRGVGIPFCVRSGDDAAIKAIEYLGAKRTGYASQSA